VNLTPAERAVVRNWTLRVFGVWAAIVVGLLMSPMLLGGFAGSRQAWQGVSTIEGRLLK
jgi:hypothetical protein